LAIIRKELDFGGQRLHLETGRMARQADGAVLVSSGDTVVLVTAVGRREMKPGQDFFPLTVNYQEKAYAAGKIPGGFFKREGRPTEKETLTSRLIDRPIRPLFPKGFMNEVQVIATVLSVDRDHDPDILAMLGASAALAISGIPFRGPIGGARVGYVNGQYVLNPSAAQLAESQLDLVVAGTRNAVLMVESEAQQLSEEVMLEAVMFGHAGFQPVIEAIEALAHEVGKTSWNWVAPVADEALGQQVQAKASGLLQEAYSLVEKQARSKKLEEIQQHMVAELAAEDAQRQTWCVVLLKKSKPVLSGGGFWMVRRALMGGTPRPCDPLRLRRGFYLAPMVRPCLPGVKPRLWSSQLWEPRAMSRLSTLFREKVVIASCSIIISRHFPPAKRAWWGHPNAVKLVTVVWQNGQ
jgi:Polyribonucleotide nucleotidyltransferase (polynucleotide phosphorylase)